MVKLTEIVEDSGFYDAELEKVQYKHSLREIYVNPKYIVSMVENKRFNEMHQRYGVVENLAKDARFTKLTMATGAQGTTAYDILGDTEHNMNKIGGL